MFLNFEEYSKYLENKYVALVGPAPTISGKNLGNIIDEYDIVVRLNKYYKIQDKKSYGTKANILYNCLSNHHCHGGMINDIPLKNINIICESHPNRYEGLHEESKKLLQSTKLKLVNKELHQELCNKTQCKKSIHVGTYALWELLHTPLKQLFVAGISFFKEVTPYIDNYHNGQFDGNIAARSPINKDGWSLYHNIDLEFNFVKNEIYKKYPQIKWDEYLEGAFI